MGDKNAHSAIWPPGLRTPAPGTVSDYTSIFAAYPDAYEAIGYCLRSGTLVAAYLAKRSESGKEVRSSNESRWPPEGIRLRLRERRRQ